MDLNDFDKPRLTEPGIKYFLNETLKQCHIHKINYHNLLIKYNLLIKLILLKSSFSFYLLSSFIIYFILIIYFNYLF